MQHKKDKWNKAIDLLCYWNLALVQGQNWSKVKDFSHVKVSAEYWIMKQNKIIVRHTTWSSFSQKKTWRRDDIWDMNQCETVVSWLFLLANCDALWAFFPPRSKPPTAMAPEGKSNLGMLIVKTECHQIAGLGVSMSDKSRGKSKWH